MKVVAKSFAFLVVALLLIASPSIAQVGLKAGDTAPALKLPASDGTEYELAQFKGEKAVALCWFPRAGSEGAKIQCAALEAVMSGIPTEELQVFGCSTAALDVTTTFAQEGKYSFPVLSDADHAAAQAYGCLRPDGLSERWTFLIDDQGAILAVSKSITPQTQGTELLKMLTDAGLIDGAGGGGAAATRPQLKPGSLFTVEFPEMPPTFYDVFEKKDVKAQMTVFLPTNYDPGRKYPLLIFLNGWDGGTGSNPGVARALSEDRDFVCAGMPLFKATDLRVTEPNVAGVGFIMSDPDARYMWPFFKAMLAKLEELVPNIDPAHRILGGFSNGAHATSGLIDESDGEVTQWFSAFLFVEGGGKLHRYDLLKGKPFLMVSSSAKSRPRAQQICDAAKAAGAGAALVSVDVGKHDFPVSAYPAVREWLRGPGME